MIFNNVFESSLFCPTKAVLIWSKYIKNSNFVNTILI